MNTARQQRDLLRDAKRVVVKIGSRVLVQRNGRPDLRRLRALTQDLARLQRQGVEVVVVSSGAVGAGMQALGMKTRPKEITDLQMAAAVGQSRLMALYDKLFAAERLRIGQVLLTHDDLKDRHRHLNARHTLLNLLGHFIIPIINENDVVSVAELKFGDNDVLAALVTLLIHADLLVLLTTVDGLRAPAGAGRTRRVACLQELTPDALALAQGKGSDLSTGGMASKLRSADMVAHVGTAVVIANGRMPQIVARICAGADVGTLIPPALPPDEAGGAFKRWLAYFQKAKGHLKIDDGARAALEIKGGSLLPIGLLAVEGRFDEGDVVDIRSLDGGLVARGLSEYSSGDLQKIRGHRSDEVPDLLGADGPAEVVHRDKLVLLKS
ncbi:MAG: glutamate 5-kinase [Kiritimatiellaeota bacterium]|nr:glutamate 5-kinase [Kiritimatiellota bacterium]